MPPGPTAPRSLAGLLAVFRPCFTAPTFQTFVGLVWLSALLGCNLRPHRIRRLTSHVRL